MARKMEAGELETTWFERHRSTPRTQIPDHWPAAYRRLVERRIEVISEIKNVRLIEKPEFKRRWSTDLWENRVQEALRSWLLDRLEEKSLWSQARLKTSARLTDELRHDGEFVEVAQLYAGHQSIDLARIVEKLVLDEVVPFLPAYRYKPTGLKKRTVWERTWDLQRQDDAIDARADLPEGDPRRLSKEAAASLKAREVGEIPVPPKYKSSDFQKTTYWRLRGKLDVPKERFIHYPGAEKEADDTPVIGWAAGTISSRTRPWRSTTESVRKMDGARIVWCRFWRVSSISFPGSSNGMTTRFRNSGWAWGTITGSLS